MINDDQHRTPVAVELRTRRIWRWVIVGIALLASGCGGYGVDVELPTRPPTDRVDDIEPIVDDEAKSTSEGSESLWSDLLGDLEFGAVADRLAAVNAIATLDGSVQPESPAARDRIARALENAAVDDPDSEVRALARDALVVWGDAETIDVGLGRLTDAPVDDPDTHGWLDLLRALPVVDGKAEAWIKLWRTYPDEAVDGLIELGPAIAPLVRSRLPEELGSGSGIVDEEQVGLLSACRVLGAIGGPDALAMLREIEADATPEALREPLTIAKAAIEARWPDGPTVAAWKRRLSTDEVEARREADRRGYESRRASGFREATAQALEEALDDPDPEVRRDAARALGAWGDTSSLERLDRCLDEPEATHWVEAIDAILVIIERGGPQYDREALSMRWARRAIRGDTEEASRVVAAIERLGEPSVPSLKALLQHREEEVRRRVCQALGRVDRGSAAAELRRIASGRDRDAVAAKEALRAIAQKGFAKGELRAILQAFGSRKARDRLAAAARLARCRPRAHDHPTLVPGLLRLARDPNPDVRRNALVALRFWYNPDTAQGLIRLVSDPTYEPWRSVTVTLATIDASTPMAEATLTRWGDESEFISEMVGSLREPESFETPLSAIAASRSEETASRVDAVRVLARIGTRESLAMIARQQGALLSPPSREAIERAAEQIAQRIEE